MSQCHTLGSTPDFGYHQFRVKVLVVRQPQGTIEGIALKRYRVGQTYEMSQALAEYLVAEGYAMIEMRDQESRSPLATADRRRRSR